MTQTFGKSTTAQVELTPRQNKLARKKVRRDNFPVLCSKCTNASMGFGGMVRDKAGWPNRTS